MRSLKILFLTVLVFLANFNFAQNVRSKIYWSKKTKTDSGLNLKKVLVANNEKTILYKTNKEENSYTNKHYLESFDKRLNLLKKENIAKPFTKNKKQVEKVFELNDEIFVLCTDKVGLKSSNNIYLHKVNNKTLVVDEEAIYIKEFEIKSYVIDFFIDVIISENENFFAVTYNQTEKLNSFDKIGFLLFNKEGTLLKDEIIIVPYTSKNILLNNFTLSENGNFAFTGDLFENTLLSKEFRKNKPNFASILFMFNDKLNERQIKHNNKLISDYKITFAENNQLFLSGFFSEKMIMNKNGFFVKKFETADLKNVASNFNLFPTKMFADNIKPKEYKRILKRKSRNGYLDLNNYVQQKAFIASNNTFIFVAEQRYKIYNENMLGNQFNINNIQQTIDINFVYGNILVAKMSKEGKIIYSKILPKKQVVGIDDVGYCSYFSCLQNNELLFFYNDHKKNFNADFTLKPPVTCGLSKNLNAVLNKIDTKGKLVAKTLFTAKQNKIYAQPFYMLQLQENNFMVYGKNNRYCKLAKIVLIP